MWFRPIALVLTLAVSAPAAADETPAPAPSPTPPFNGKEIATLQDYGLAHAECVEWSDGCAVCRHDGPSQSHCSLPGIACQPVDIVCKAP